MIRKVACFCLLACLSLGLSANPRIERLEKDVGNLLWKMVSGGLEILKSRIGPDYEKIGIDLGLIHYGCSNVFKLAVGDKYEELSRRLSINCSEEDMKVLHRLLAKHAPQAMDMLEEVLRKEVPNLSDQELSKNLLEASAKFWMVMEEKGLLERYHHAIKNKDYAEATNTLKACGEQGGEVLAEPMMALYVVIMGWSEAIEKDKDLQSRIKAFEEIMKAEADKLSKSCFDQASETSSGGEL